MSVAIAIKDKDKICLAADSQCTAGISKVTLSNPNNYKIWKTKGLNNSIMCHAGPCRDLGIIRYRNFIPETRAMKGNIDMDFVQGKMIYDMYDAIDERGFIDKTDGSNMPSEYLFTYKDKLFDLSECLYVLEVEDYIAIGSGKDVAMGSLASTIGEAAEIRLIKAVVAAANIDSRVGYPIIVTDTETCEFKIYDENDVKKLLNQEDVSRSSKLIKVINN